jgi:hypothetical protein
MNMDREQLDALKRQIEEEYKLDMAAIERLQRRFMTAGGSNGGGRSLSTATSAVSAAPAYLAPVPEVASSPAPIVELPQERQPDELTGTLRAMFSGQRK